ncbi:MAG: amidophosphoribosyltransferase [Candidatus Marinimicrobia bacterium]|nr:amidophosphoribosyltransferase [Candidatus Neomarinimicrobiota bacterium]|tara:strand:+ start:3241 stop:4617 length:1377 start_codon:yes stop_codon:yes gene_type:complete
MCGIIGVYNNPEAATLAYMGLYAQQHRGQEGAGVISSDGTKLHRHMGQGLVSDVFSDSTIFESLPGHSSIGHVRYSTTGDSDPRNVGPLTFNVGDEYVSIAHNGNLVNLDQTRKDLQADGALFQTSTDTEIIIHLLAREKGNSIDKRLESALKKVQGAFSLLMITPNEVIAARDPHGIRPFCIGKLENTYILASETCALDLLGAEYVRDVNPGELIVINDDGMHSRQISPPTKSKHCIFEYIYFSRPDSQIFGNNVDKMRRKFGKVLSDEQPAKTADMVISVPDSSNTCALGYSQSSGIKHEIGLIRNHYVGRTFIFPTQFLRDLSVRLKFNTVKGVIENREVVVIDDSIVRGTTLKKLVKLLRSSGAKKVHVRISSPPVKHPCFYGMDFPTTEELVAGQHNVEEITEIIDADSLGYLSLDGTLESTHLEKDNFCTACFSGDYPIALKGDNGKAVFEG